MNITNKVVTEYINGFYKERTTALCELRKKAEANHVPIILRDTEDLLESLVLLKIINQNHSQIQLKFM